MKRFSEFKKFDPERQIAYGVVFSPHAPDSQHDWMEGDDIEKMAHQFNASGRQGNVDVNHDLKPCGGRVVESFIARKGDDTFPPGSWIAGVQCPDPIWKRIKSGELTGFSMYGKGRRIEKELPGNPQGKYQLTDGEIEAVSLVTKPANRQRFEIMKSENAATALARIGATLEKMGNALDAVSKRLDANDERIKALSTGMVHKAAAPQQDPAVHRLLRKRDRLNDRLMQTWERPDQFDAEAEQRISKSLQAVEDELFAHGFEDQGVGIDSNSAFYQRGGTSSWLSGGGMSLEDSLGINRHSRTITKQDEDEISLNCLVL